MLLETIGIGLIIPFMQALITEGVNKDIAEFLNIFKIFPKSKSNLILIFGSWGFIQALSHKLPAVLAVNPPA